MVTDLQARVTARPDLSSPTLEGQPKQGVHSLHKFGWIREPAPGHGARFFMPNRPIELLLGGFFDDGRPPRQISTRRYEQLLYARRVDAVLR